MPKRPKRTGSVLGSVSRTVLTSVGIAVVESCAIVYGVILVEDLGVESRVHALAGST